MEQTKMEKCPTKLILSHNRAKNSQLNGLTNKSQSEAIKCKCFNKYDASVLKEWLTQKVITDWDKLFSNWNHALYMSKMFHLYHAQQICGIQFHFIGNRTLKWNLVNKIDHLIFSNFVRILRTKRLQLKLPPKRMWRMC